VPCKEERDDEDDKGDAEAAIALGRRGKAEDDDDQVTLKKR